MANPKSIAQNTTYLTISFVFQKILSFIYFTLIARLIGVEGTGIYVFAISYTTIFSVFIDLGLSPVLTRESARNKEQSEKYLANILGLKIILSFFILLAVLTSINLVGKPPLTRLMVYLASALMVLDSFTLSFWALFRGWQNFFYEAKSVVFTQIIIVTVGITGILLKFPLYVLVIALISGSVFNFSYSLILLKKNLTIKPRLEFDKKTVRFLLTIAIPFALAGIFTRFYSYLDQVLLSFLSGDQAVGWYAVPYKITFAFQFIPAAFGSALFPAMSTFYLDNKERLRKSFEKATAYLIIIALPASVGIGVLAREIIVKIYGASYEPSILSLRILIAGLVFIFVNFPIGSLLNSSDRQVHNTVILGLTMILNLAANLILIPRYSYIGASIAALISVIFLLILGLVLARQVIKYNVWYLLKILLKSLGASLIMGLLVFYLKNSLNFIIVIPIGGLVYFIVMWLIKGLSRSDLELVYRTIRQKRLL